MIHVYNTCVYCRRAAYGLLSLHLCEAPCGHGGAPPATIYIYIYTHNKQHHIYIYCIIYIYIHVLYIYRERGRDRERERAPSVPASTKSAAPFKAEQHIAAPAITGLLRHLHGGAPPFKIHQSGVQWNQGVVVYYMIGCFTIQYYPHPLHPHPTAPPSDENPSVARAPSARWVFRDVGLSGCGVSDN